MSNARDLGCGGEAAIAIGRLIRSRRNIKGLTLKDLATGIERSVAYVSLLERGRAEPSLATLRKICDQLEMPLSWLLEDATRTEDPNWVVRHANRRKVAFMDNRVEKEMMTRDEGRLQLITLRFAPGSHTGEAPWYHNGESAGTVLMGWVEVEYDGRRVLLETGDTYRFDGNLPHFMRNPTDEQAEMLIVVTPPYY